MDWIDRIFLAVCLLLAALLIADRVIEHRREVPIYAETAVNAPNNARYLGGLEQ